MGPIMRSHEDDLGMFQCIRRFKTVSWVAMLAAFSASLDGYQINLNGGIVSNKGFIRQMAAPGTSIISGKYIAAWGGIQSAGQTVGQIVCNHSIRYPTFIFSLSNQFLQYATERFGRKVAFYIIWVDIVISVFIETFATKWEHWLVAKLFSGMGVAARFLHQRIQLVSLQLLIWVLFLGLTISSWFVLGQIFASVALQTLSKNDPYDFRVPIYTQWAMVGLIAVIFLVIPESPWWLASQGKIDKAAKVLNWFNGKVDGYSVDEQIEIMTATITEERIVAERNAEEGTWAVFQGNNRIRFLIAAWPKIAQQLVGLAVFNTYATYFFQYAGSKDPFMVTVILSCVQLLSMILTATTTDKLGRRPLTIYPYAVTSVSLLCLGIIGCFNYTKPATSSLLIFFACLATLSTTGASAIGYAYAAEIPQQRLRAKTAGWALALSNAIAIMFSFCTPLMINNEPVSAWGVKTGFFFAGTGTVAVIVAWLILPEVARRTPAEIDEMFEKKVGLRKFKGYVTEVQMRSNEQYDEHEML
ncbi:unnamed protein product [Penicillium salamii]|nr:unnamed protein product [Penicillium salamii]